MTLLNSPDKTDGKNAGLQTLATLVGGAAATKLTLGQYDIVTVGLCIAAGILYLAYEITG